jgi:LysM repeat protein
MGTLKFKLLFLALAWTVMLWRVQAQSDASYFVYTVKAEDKSLWGICQYHSVSVESVKSLNQLKRNGLKVGVKLKIPLKTQLNKVVGTSTHIVSDADKSLWAICRKYDVSVDTVKLLNTLNSSSLSKGQALLIPTGHLVIHTVVKSDKSIWRISKNYGVDLADLKSFNGKKNNIIRNGEKLLIPKKWITQTEILIQKEQDELSSLWQMLQKPVFNLAKNKRKFSFKEKKQFRIDQEVLNGMKVKYRLSKEDYVRLFQQSSQRSSFFYNTFNFKSYNALYYYSIESPFLIDLSSLDYYTESAKEERQIADGYVYDFISLVEVDTHKNSIEIIPVFLYKAFFGKVERYFGRPLKGAFSCCANPHPLAHYSKTETKETIGFSELIQPSVLKYTEVIRHLDSSQITSIDSTIHILQFESFDVPTLIDIEEYKDGQLKQAFIRTKRRKRIGY